MKLFCCYTPAHRVLYERIFAPSIPQGYEVRSTEVQESGAGDYLSAEFLRCVRMKVGLIVESLEDFPDETLVWSDVDIRFVKLPVEQLISDLENSGADIAFQRESPKMRDVNTGFFVCRPTTPVRKFFERIQRYLETDASLNEQMAANHLLRESGEVHRLRWGFLPPSYYARTHGWPPPRNLAIYHANYTKGSDAVGLKLAQFEELEGILTRGWPARVASIVRRLPRKMFVSQPA